MVRTMGVRRGLESRQLTKAGAAVFMAVALRQPFKALGLDQLANNRGLLKAEERINYDPPLVGGDSQTPRREREGRTMYACH